VGKINLSDIQDLPAFEEVASLFHQITGMVISFYDKNGRIVFYPVETRCDFCNLIQSFPKGRRRCHLSDKEAARKAMETGKSISYTCHAGLTDIVVPVIVAGKKIGCFYSGQSLTTQPTPMGYEKIRARVNDLDLDQDKLWEYYQTVPVVDDSHLQTAIGLLSMVCNHLVEGHIAIRNERVLTRELRKLRRAAEERVRLERDLREMELRLLQAQINPHFLFNTLNVIIGQSMAENASQTTKLVENLSFLLRGCFTRIGSLVPLSEEVDSAKAYIDIFSARFDRRLSVEIDLPADLWDFSVPTLILQPLVENTLVHALPRCAGQLVLNISAKRVGNSVRIIIANNGPSLGPDELIRVMQLLRNQDPEGKLTGLAGVNRRLKYYYDGIEDMQVDVSKGFKVVINIPFIQK
jgi:two-component system LytT family sensor kinase